jgi:hypothetical protein
LIGILGAGGEDKTKQVAMLQTLRLLAPALIPSWRFFKEVAPSPRIQYALIATRTQTPDVWTEARPRPAHLPFSAMLLRMLWNPRWNETLFMVSCAERLMDAPTAHSVEEIAKRIARDLGPQTGFLQFRLVFIHRQGAEIVTEVEYLSPAFAMAPGA